MKQVEKKAGYKSTEFWMSMAAVAVGAIASTGLVEDNEFAAKIVGLITATLVALGYTGSRLTLKKHALDAQVKLNGGDTNSNTEGDTETPAE
tara:strand:- start:977 stop:1252 length:276 start_codon:yes stop_codon:yes gene_type:complete